MPYHPGDRLRKASHTLWLLGLVVLFFLLGTLFVGLVPLWESPDEPSHFSHAYYLLLHRNAPRPGSTVFDHIQLYEARHPPLYYAMAASFLALWQ